MVSITTLTLPYGTHTKVRLASSNRVRRRDKVRGRCNRNQYSFVLMIDIGSLNDGTFVRYGIQVSCALFQGRLNFPYRDNTAQANGMQRRKQDRSGQI